MKRRAFMPGLAVSCRPPAFRFRDYDRTVGLILDWN
jgi:hypothetical protein